MIIEVALYQILKDDATIADLTGGRIFGGKLPQKRRDGAAYDSFPAMVYKPPPLGGREVVRVLEGGCALIAQPLHIFSVASSNYGAAARLDDAAFHALDEFRGTVTDPITSESLVIEAVFSDNFSHAYSYIDALEIHQFVSEYLFHYLDPMTGD